MNDKPSTGMRDARRLMRRPIPHPAQPSNVAHSRAWLLSVVLHAGLVMGLAFLWTSTPHGTSRHSGGPIGIAVVHQQLGEDQYLLAGESESNSQESEVRNVELPSLESAQSSQDSLIQGLLPQLDSGGSSSAAAGDLGLGSGNSALASSGRVGAVKASLFGIEGEGTRFVYVIDRSDSMNGFEGKPMRQAKRELLDSLKSLGPTHQFQVVFYNDTPTVYGGTGGRGPQLVRGDDRSKSMVQQFVHETSASGGTNHVDALRLAMAMGPDILFFLTDGDFPQPPSGALENILTRAARAGTTIHCIQFGEGSRTGRGGWISDLATACGGEYRYVDVSQF